MSKGQQPKRVRDMDSGEEFASISDAAEAIGATQSALSTAIASHRACKGRWIVPIDEVLCACCKGIVERKRLSPNYGQAA